MFERFTERARQVVVLAQEEARNLGHDYIGTEHVLLGLLREEEGLAARVLESLDVTVERVRDQVVRVVGRGKEISPGQIPFTPRAKKVLELALRESRGLGHSYIGTEHILLGLVRENEGVAARILLDFDADSEKIRNEVIRMLSGPSGPRGEPGAASHAAEHETWEPSLRWDQARVVWTADGAALEVPLLLERRAIALLRASELWQLPPLAATSADLLPGRLRLVAPALLETVDPIELRRVLDEAVTRAHDDAAAERQRETLAAEAFLAALRGEPLL